MRYRRAFVPGGTYFFTVNLANRSHGLLIEHVDLLRMAFKRVRARHPFEIPAMVVLPDHLHAIWTLPEGDADFPLRWSQIKGTFSRLVPERDLARHIDYIHINPVKHGHVRRAVDWPYSSIHRFIRDGRLSADWACAPHDGEFGELPS